MPKFHESLRLEYKIFAAILAVGILNSILFSSLTPGASTGIIFFAGWQASLVVYIGYFVLSILLIFLKKAKLLRFIFVLLLAFMTAHIVLNLALLIIDPHISDNGRIILIDALLIWALSMTVFALWYWITDRGGPVARLNENEETRYDLLFPQYQSKIPGWTEWKPKFLDYLFFSFFTSTGFSPADTLPLTKRVKFLMMVEAFISLIIIGMVVSRAISLLQ